METGRSLHFAATARTLADATRALGLEAPGFRSPPRVAGARRTVRRHAGGLPTVAVLVRERPWPAVLADMIEGVVVANGLRGPEAELCRDSLWVALEPVLASGHDGAEASGPAGRRPGAVPPTVSSAARVA